DLQRSSTLIRRFIGPDITDRSVLAWSLHAALVGGDAVGMTGREGDFVDGWTTREQGVGEGMGCSQSACISQQRINFQVRVGVHRHVGGVLLVGSEIRSRATLDQVVAIGGE